MHADQLFPFRRTTEVQHFETKFAHIRQPESSYHTVLRQTTAKLEELTLGERDIPTRQPLRCLIFAVYKVL